MVADLGLGARERVNLTIIGEWDARREREWSEKVGSAKAMTSE